MNPKSQPKWSYSYSLEGRSDPSLGISMSVPPIERTSSTSTRCYQQAIRNSKLPDSHRIQCAYLRSRIEMSRPSISTYNTPTCIRRASEGRNSDTVEELARQEDADELRKNVKHATSPYCESKMRFPFMATETPKQEKSPPSSGMPERLDVEMALEFYEYAANKLREQSFDSLAEASVWFERLYFTNVAVCGRKASLLVVKELSHQYDSVEILRSITEQEELL